MSISRKIEFLWFENMSALFLKALLMLQQSVLSFLLSFPIVLLIKTDSTRIGPFCLLLG